MGTTIRLYTAIAISAYFAVASAYGGYRYMSQNDDFGLIGIQAVILTRSQMQGSPIPIFILISFAVCILMIAWSAYHALAGSRAVQAICTTNDNAPLPNEQSSDSPNLLSRSIARKLNILGSKDLNFQSAAVLLEEADNLDGVELADAHSVIKILIWTLPVLGFIGTALEMSHAIVGFADGLSSNLDTKGIAEVMSTKVIPGLGNAFRTTMIALSATVVAYFCETTVDRTIDTKLAELSEWALRRAAKLVGKNKIEDLFRRQLSVSESISSSLNGVRDLAQQTLDEIGRMVNAVNEAGLGGDSHTQQIAAVVANIEKVANATAQKVGEANEAIKFIAGASRSLDPIQRSIGQLATQFAQEPNALTEIKKFMPALAGALHQLGDELAKSTPQLAQAASHLQAAAQDIGRTAQTVQNEFRKPINITIERGMPE